MSYRQNGKVIAESTCFPFSLPGDDETTIGLMGLLGVPSTLTPGKYLLEWKDGEGQEGNRFVTILQREFVQEDIPLNQTMTDLRQTPDPKKIEEYRQLICDSTEYQPRTSILYWKTSTSASRRYIHQLLRGTEENIFTPMVMWLLPYTMGLILPLL